MQQHTALPGRLPQTGYQDRLQIDTDVHHLDVEAATWSAMRNTTCAVASVATDERVPGRERSTTVLKVPAPAISGSEPACEFIERSPCIRPQIQSC